MKKLLLASVLGLGATLSQASDLTGEWLCRIEVTSNEITVKSELIKTFAEDGTVVIDNDATYYFNARRPNIEVTTRSQGDWSLADDKLVITYTDSELLSAFEVDPQTTELSPVSVPEAQVLIPNGYQAEHDFRFDGSRIFLLDQAPNDLKCFKQNVQ